MAPRLGIALKTVVALAFAGAIWTAGCDWLIDTLNLGAIDLLTRVVVSFLALTLLDRVWTRLATAFAPGH